MSKQKTSFVKRDGLSYVLLVDNKPQASTTKMEDAHELITQSVKEKRLSLVDDWTKCSVETISDVKKILQVKHLGYTRDGNWYNHTIFEIIEIPIIDCELSADQDNSEIDTILGIEKVEDSESVEKSELVQKSELSQTSDPKPKVESILEPESPQSETVGADDEVSPISI